MKKSKLKKLIKQLKERESKLLKENTKLSSELRKEKENHPITLGEFKKLTKGYSDDLVLVTDVMDNYYNGPVISIDTDKNSIVLTNYMW